jgi:mannosyltransferase OCH1-like enzyme
MNALIPKKIHISWKYKDVLEDSCQLIKLGLKNLVDLNSNWEIKIHDDFDVEEYLKANLEFKDYQLFNNCHIVEKIDIWRLFKLYNEGGLYSDLDRLHNISLDSILEENTMCVIPICNDFDFSHTFMLSAPKNVIYQKTIELLLERRFNGEKNIYFLGPQTYMHALTECLTGEMINTNPGKEKFQEIKDAIKSMPFLKTYVETGPGDLITNKSEIDEIQYESYKREFYNKCGIKHWTGDW